MGDAATAVRDALAERAVSYGDEPGYEWSCWQNALGAWRAFATWRVRDSVRGAIWRMASGSGATPEWALRGLLADILGSSAAAPYPPVAPSAAGLPSLSEAAE